MPVHAAAYLATVNAASYTQLTALSDPFFQVSGTAMRPPRDVRVLGAGAGGSGLTHGRLEAAGLLRVAYPGVVPLNGAVTVAAGLPRVMDNTDRPLMLTGGEDVYFAVKNGGAAATFGLLLVGFDVPAVPSGESFWLRYSKSGITATANAWTPYTDVTWEQTLPSGTYAIIGMDHWGATAAAARLILAGSRYRPGVYAHVNAAASEGNGLFLQGRLGVLGYFTNQQLPGVEVLCTGADTSFDGVIRVVRIGGPEMMPAPAR